MARRGVNICGLVIITGYFFECGSIDE
jgi:hypothetical protein